jgi:hypothetical protein
MPVWLTAEEPDFDQFVLALTDDQRLVRPSTPMEETFRRYLITPSRAGNQLSGTVWRSARSRMRPTTETFLGSARTT